MDELISHWLDTFVFISATCMLGNLNLNPLVTGCLLLHRLHIDLQLGVSSLEGLGSSYWFRISFCRHALLPNTLCFKLADTPRGAQVHVARRFLPHSPPTHGGSNSLQTSSITPALLSGDYNDNWWLWIRSENRVIMMTHIFAFDQGQLHGNFYRNRK